MLKVELNKQSNENPFYGLKNCLTLFQNVGKEINESLLDKCYLEVKDNKQHKELFYSLLFSIGDITARQHNIFKGIKKDTGGNANREGFYKAMLWLMKRDYKQFLRFLYAGLFNEYTCFDMLFRSRVKTKGTRVIEVFDIFSNEQYRKDLVDYIYKIIKGNNPFDKLLVAKFLTIPRLSKRSKHKKMLSETKQVMENKAIFLKMLSEVCHWDYVVNGTYVNFSGYKNWRKDYNKDLESVLFSSGKIKEFDETSFLNWFDKLPAQARYRVKNRILYSKSANGEFKYPIMQEWYTKWEEYKTKKQEEQRVLEEKIRQGQGTLDDKIKLEKVKKEAKVTTGAVTFKDLYDDILRGKIDKLKLESFITNKVNLPYNSLVIIDDSGSMHGAPFNFAKFIASVCLVKNPDDDARNLLGFFSSSSQWYSYIDRTTLSPNSLWRKEISKINPKPLVDPKLSFYDNYINISSFCDAAFQGGGTYLDSIPRGLRTAISNNPDILDALKNYPVWTIISDGDLNSSRNAHESMLNFFKECESILGYKPFVVMIEIDNYNNNKINHFEGIENMIYISSVNQIEQFLTNFKDIDIFDVYAPLLSIYRSNRYDLIKENTL